MSPVQTKAEVIERLQKQGEQLRALGVARLGLFGSFVRDKASRATPSARSCSPCFCRRSMTSALV